MSSSRQVDQGHERKNISDLLALTPMQEGILYHYLKNPISSLYFEQVTLNLKGNLDVYTFKESWEYVIRRNPCLRTVFRWKTIQRPVQMILKELDMDFSYADLSELSDEQLGAELVHENSMYEDHMYEEHMYEEHMHEDHLHEDHMPGVCIHEKSVHEALTDEIQMYEVLRHEQQMSKELATLIKKTREIPFDLENGPVFRIQLYKIASNHYTLVLNYHHIILDGWSIGILLKEAFQVYHQLRIATPLDYTEKDSLKEYLKWYQARDIQGEIVYWKEYLEGFHVRTALPTDTMNSALLSGANNPEIGRLSLTFSQELSSALREFAKAHKLTITDLFNTAWGILLQKYNNCNDVLFGVTVATRPPEIPGIENLTGLLINTLPLRVQCTAEETVLNLLKKIHQISQERKVYESTSLAEIQQSSQLEGQDGLFASLLVVENYPLDRIVSQSELSVESFAAFEQTNYDMTMVITDDENYDIQWLYQLNLFSERSVVRIHRLFTTLLESIITNPTEQVSLLSILSQQEYEQILYEFNHPIAESTDLQPIPYQWLVQADTIPDQQALIYGDDIYTYAELKKRINQVYGKLRDKGVRSENIVGIIAEPSPEMIYGILGILQSGAAYVPIDPNYPSERINYILQDSGAKVVLTQDKFAEYLQGLAIDSMIIEEITEEDSASYPGLVVEEISPKNLAYVIYTSGSTGKPKGVLVEHQSLSNLLAFMQKKYPVTPDDTWLLKTTFTFDVSLTEIFGWILGGGRLAILESGGEKNPQRIVEAIKQYQVTHLNFVPSMLNLFIDILDDSGADRLASLKYLMVAGEPISKEQVEGFQKFMLDVEFINLYGPTETTIYATEFPLKEVSTYPNVPIGRPIDNLQALILDRYNQIQPVGFIGELCIRGVGVSRGYINQFESTAEKFISFMDKDSKEILYRTGDLARWLADGNIEFLGRIDQQVKIRGYRIEPGEIQSHLLKHPLIKEAVVIHRKDQNGDGYLCAYLVIEPGQVNEIAYISKERVQWIKELRRYLAEVLPVYMIPAQMVILDKLPLLANGKLDRKTLPEPECLVREKAYVAPQSPLEEKLVEIWEMILGGERIGVEDDFFKMGGHSLKVIQITQKINKELEQEITIKEFYDNPTIRQCAELLQARAGVNSAYRYIEIPPAPAKVAYSLSSAQKRLYLFQQLNEGTTVYNMPLALEIKGEINLEKLKRVISQIIQRHQSLRTQFVQIKGQLYQKINEQSNLQIQQVELREDQLNSYLHQFIQSFDLSQAPLMRMELITLTEDRQILLVDFHHIIADGSSLDILVKEFSQLYAGQELTPLKVQYRDYTEWQNQRLTLGELDVQKNYWLEELAGELPQLNLPTDFRRPGVQSFAGERYSIHLETKLADGLDKLAKAKGVTVFTLLLSAYNLLLSKYSGQEEIILGIPVVGRSHLDTQQVMGMFVNTLALRLYSRYNDHLDAYLEQIHTKVLLGIEHQEYPIELLVEELNLARDMSRNPLFDTMFVLEENHRRAKELRTSGLEFKYYPLVNPVAKFDLLLSAEITDKGISLCFDYAAKLFKNQTIQQMARHYQQLLIAMIQKPDARLQDLELLTPEAKDQLVFTFNDTVRDYAKQLTIHQVFESNVLKVPNKEAVTYEGQSLTYYQLNQWANYLARILRAKGVGADEIIGLMLEPSLEMVVSMLGIFKAGGGYLPIDKSWPQERKLFVLKDAGVKILLTDSTSSHVESTDQNWGDAYEINLTEYGILTGSDVEFKPSTLREVFGSDEYLNDFKDTLLENLPSISTSQNLAYVIYTSGSTGQPKGVMVDHQGVLRLVQNPNYVELTEEDRFLNVASYTFDASVFIFWTSLLNAAHLTLIPNELVWSYTELAKVFKEERITTTILTTAHYNQFIEVYPEGLRSLKNLFIGGEALSVSHIQKGLELLPTTRLINAYGPTENTVMTTCYTITHLPEAIQSIPIGHPTNNCRVYVLDQHLKLQPVGMIGELYIAGDGLARGYLNRPDLNQQRFIPSPLIPGEVVYKSGDLARFLADGTLEFFGRSDQQVKVRGYRIELGEIEATLQKNPKIQQAIVVVKKDEHGVSDLIAYLVADQEIPVVDLRKYMLKTLPEYMIPNRFIFLDSIPLTSHGKVDYKALPEPISQGNREKEYVKPQGLIEETLVHIYSQVLEVKQVGVDDSFFDLGGHSLKATRITARIAEELEIEVPLSLIFKYPIIKDLAQEIKILNQSSSGAILSQPVQNQYFASSAQRRMYLLDRIDPTSTTYNIPMAIMLNGELHIPRLEEAFRKIIQRHEALRTRFEYLDGELYQYIDNEIDFMIRYVTIETDSDESPTIEQVEEKIYQLIRPFDLAETPLFRVYLIRLSDTTHLMFIDIHHIIADGVSLEIMINELTQIYAGEDLPELNIQYQDFVRWQMEFFQTPEFRAQEEYWLNQFSDSIPLLSLPLDTVRPNVQIYEGDSLEVRIDPELTQKLRQLAKSLGVTLYMLLFAAYNVFLARYASQEEVIVGTPITGRSHPDLEKMVGMFVNTLAIHTYPELDKQFITYLDQIKEQVLHGLENQDYPFEMLVDKLNLRRDLSRNPLFDTMFDMHTGTLAEKEFTLQGLKLAPYSFKSQISKFDLNLTMVNRAEGLICRMTYCRKLFSTTTIKRMLAHYGQLLQGIAKNPKEKIGLLPLMSIEERNQIIYEFNHTRRDHPRDRVVYQLFETFAGNQPDQIAVVTGEEELSFAELNLRGNQLARYLCEQGLTTGKMVGIMVDRTVAMVVGVIGVFKAGGAYIPIDPLYPQDRVQFLLADAGVEILLTTDKYLKLIPAEWTGEVVIIDNPLIQEIGNIENLDLSVTGEDLAYVIYTSGSTGQPKGVMVEHRNLLNSYYSWVEQFALNTYRPQLLQVASFSFDVFIADICRSICVGGKLVIAGDERSSLLQMYQVMISQQINLVNGTPGILLPLMEYIYSEGLELPYLKYLLIGADSWQMADFQKLSQRYGQQFKIANCYGVTEAAVDATWYMPERNIPELARLVPIGKPIFNVQVYVLDQYLNPIPVGVVGEIYIGGLGVARGYLNRFELTEERFIPDPYNLNQLTASERPRLYRTGDLGRYLPDGNIEFLGRADKQVKIRGYRIELGEIESCLLNHPTIAQGVVIARAGKDGIFNLIGYFVPKLTGESIDDNNQQSIETNCAEDTIQEIESYLRNQLPEYMVPQWLIPLSQLPLTPNGKVDTDNLPDVQITHNYRPPLTQTEKHLAAIWQQYLGVEAISQDDNFFHLGGHSLKAMQILAKIYQEFSVELTMGQFFANPILCDQANLIDQTQPVFYQPIKPQFQDTDYYPASSAQNRLFFLYQFEESMNYNMPAVLQIQGRLDIPLLQHALNEVMKLHESLRTSFKLIKGEVVQQVQQNINFQLVVREVVDDETEIQEAINEFLEPFDLAKTPLLRSAVFQLGNEKYLFLLDMHHIISDGVSMDILINQLIRSYHGQSLTPPKIQYRDYAVWQHKALAKGYFVKQEAFWLAEFSDEIPVLALPCDYPRPLVRSHQGNSVSFTLDQELLSGLHELTTKTQTTLYMNLLAVFNILLARYSGQEDIIIGTPVAGRAHPDVQDVVGMFVNTLALRNYPVMQQTYEEFVSQVKINTLKAFENQDYQFEMLIDKLNLERDPGRNPLFDVVLVLQNTEHVNQMSKMEDVIFTDYDFDFPIAKFDLTWTVMEKAGELHCILNYCTKLFKTSTIHRMIGHLTNILYDVIRDSKAQIGMLNILSSEEKKLILEEFNQTSSNYPKDVTIQQVFEKQVERYGERTAVVLHDEILTYHQLNSKANQLAVLLRQSGVRPDGLVGLLMGRSIEMIVSIIGVLKAGGAYVPLDPEYPEERIRYMLEDAEIQILITESSLIEQIPAEYSGQVICVDQILTDDSVQNLQDLAGPSNLAYIIYTSGSTGKPKGMMIEHLNVIRLFKSEPGNYDFTELDVWTLFHSYCFDFSVWEIFGALLYGGKLVIVDQETRIDTQAFIQLCKREKVTVLNQTPAAFYNFIEVERKAIEHQLSEHLRYIIFGGEALNFNKLLSWLELYSLDQIELINMYGITETTVHVTYEKLQEEDLKIGHRSLVGKPIYTTTVYLLDQQGNLVPQGVPGEIYVGGLGLGRGYLNRPELTAEKFITHPLFPGERLYRSGDLGRYLEDGNLEYLGRIDQQVKIRGFRIELGEIEENILKYPAIRDVVVIQRIDQQGQNYLIAYLVLHEEVRDGFLLDELKETISKNLPDYMIPTAFVILEELPLTMNGKVNRKALPEPELGKGLEEYEPPKTELELQLAAIWQQVLEVEQIGINASFFNIGGNSLRLMKVFHQLKEEFPDLEITITDLFKYNSISELATFILKQNGDGEVIELEEDDEIEEFIM